MRKALDSIPTQHGVNLPMVAIPVIPAVKRLKQGSEVQIHAWLHIKLKAGF